MNLPNGPSAGYLAALQSMPAPGALPPAHDLGEIDGPALPPGIDASWLQGQAPNPAALGGAGIPSITPATGPTMPQQAPIPPPAPAVAPLPTTDLGDIDAPPGPAPGPAATRPQPFLHQVAAAGGYMAPARETELRGPQLKTAQGERNAAFEGAVKAVTERSEQTAAGDYALALEQERKAGIREDAANYTAAERADEMAQRTADFDQSVKAMGEAGTIDPSRFWSSANAGQKIGMMISLLVGGLAEAKGARNTGAEAFKTIAANDVKAQEFAYNATRDVSNAKQTAFSMAMQKYNNVDAARAAARAASLDAISAQVGQQAALWKGTDAANRAQMALASLQDERMNQIAQGVAFSPARMVATAPSWVDADGIHYNEQQVRDLKKEERGQEHELRKQGEGVAGQLLVEGAKAGAKANDKTDEGTRFIAEKLQTAGVPQARAAAEEALQALNKSPGGKIEAIDRAITPDSLANAAHSHESNAREQAYHGFKNAAMKAIAGNVTASEEARMDKQFGQANDPESRKRAINSALEMLKGIEKGIKAGASPEVQAEYDRRRQNAEGAPPAAPKGSSTGWK